MATGVQITTKRSGTKILRRVQGVGPRGQIGPSGLPGAGAGVTFANLDADKPQPSPTDPVVTAAAFRALFDKAFETGRPAVIQAANYTSRQIIVSQASIEIIFDDHAVLKLADGSNTSLIQVDAAGVTIKGGTFDGNKANQSTDLAHVWAGGGVIDAFQPNFTLDNAVVHDGQGYGVRTLRTSPKVQNCSFYSNNYIDVFMLSYYELCDTPWVLFNKFSRNTNNIPLDLCICIRAHVADVTNAKVIGNHCVMLGGVGYDIMGVELQTDLRTLKIRDPIVMANTFVNGGQGISTGRVDGGIFVGNIMKNIGVNGIEIAINTTNSIISGNRIDLNPSTGQYGIWVTSPDVEPIAPPDAVPESTGNVVTGNTFVGGSAAGIYLYNAGAVVSDNTVIMAGGSNGIYALACDRTKIQGNRIYGTMGRGILVANFVRANVSGNEIEGSTTDAVLFTDGGVAGTYKFTCLDNDIAPASGNGISRVFNGSSIFTGSRDEGNSSPTGPVDGYAYDPWKAFTPTLTANSGTLTASTISGRYQRVGRKVDVEIFISITTNGPAAGFLTVGLPFAVGDKPIVLPASERSVTGKSCVLRADPGATTGTLVLYDNTYPGVNGATIAVTGSYMAA